MFASLPGCAQCQVNKTLKNQRYTVMVSPQLSQARFLRVTGGKELADDSIVHNDAPVEFTVGISAGEVVLERLPASRRRCVGSLVWLSGCVAVYPRHWQ